MPRWLKEGIDADTKMQTNAKVREIVENIIADLEERGDAAVREYSKKFDGWSPESYRLSREEIDACYDQVPQSAQFDEGC